MKKTIGAILIIAPILYLAQLSDENFLPKIIPPSPSAYSLGRFGNIEAGEFTGSANINIPLLSFSGNKLTTNVFLTYSSNGIKVDEKEGEIGLGWTLISGGVVNRIVRGKDDFVYNKLTPPDNFSGGVENPKVAQFFYDAGSNTTDSEDDLFTFSIGNLSGQFVLNKKNGATLISRDDIKIEVLNDSNYNPYFILTDSNGIQYHLSAIEETYTRVSGGGHSIPSPISITAWFLTKIENPQAEQILFEYENKTEMYTTSRSQTLSYSSPPIQNDCEITYTGGESPKVYSKSPTLGPILSHETNITGKRLKRITGNQTNERIEFGYTTAGFSITQYNNTSIIEKLDFKVTKTANNRLFLNAITSLTKSKDYTFDYERQNDFPMRLSFSQDHWGYFNGKYNSNIVPKNIKQLENLDNVNYNGADKEPDHSKSVYGLLKKITYPTKGTTSFIYEPHSYYGTVKVYPPKKSFLLGLVSKADEFQMSKTEIIQTPFEQEIKLTGYGSFNSQDCASSYNMGTKHMIDLKIRDMQTGQLVQLRTKDSQGNLSVGYSSVSFSGGQAKDYFFIAKTGKTYQIELFSNFMCTNGSVSFQYYNQPPVDIQQNIFVGGNRISKIIDNDGTQDYVKKYYYGAQQSLNKSSGEKGLDPFYMDFRKWEAGCQATEILRDAVITSSSIFPLFDSGRSNIYYKYVTISHGGESFEKGGVEKEFIINRNYWGNQLFGSENVGAAPWTNFGWNNGYLKSERFFDNTSKTLKVNENVWENRNIVNNKSYYVRKNYSPKVVNNPVYTCTADDISRPNNGTYWVCTTNHNHLLSVAHNWKCTLPNSHNIEKELLNQCYQKTQGYQVIHPYAIENLDVVEYDNISSQKFLKKIISTDYRNNLPMHPIFTENFYNSQQHLQPTSQKVTYPDTSVRETNYSYAHEKGNQLMISKNMIGIPLETETKETLGTVSKTVSKTETVYPTSLPTPEAGNLVLPLSEKSYDILNNAPSTDITYNLYDTKGNIQQYTAKEGIPVTIIWGYNQTQPIAKIEGLKLSDIPQSLIDSIVNPSNTDAAAAVNNDETAFLTALDNFRKNTALFNYQVTTYTYDPLVGVRSITQPSGIREVYTYDSANRLKEIKVWEKNSAGNYVYKTVKEFKYNYKP